MYVVKVYCYLPSIPGNANANQFSLRKAHDSNTSPTKDMYQTVGSWSILEVASHVGDADWQSNPRWSPPSSPQTSSDGDQLATLLKVVRLDESDSEDGGTRI